MTPIGEKWDPRLSADLAEQSLLFRIHTQRDAYLHTKESVLSLAKILTSQRYSPEQYRLLPSRSLQGLEIADQIFPVLPVSEVGPAVVLLDGNLHQIIASTGEEIWLRYRSLPDRLHRTQPFAPELKMHSVKNNLVCYPDRTLNTQLAGSIVSAYTLPSEIGVGKRRTRTIFFWEMHNLPEDSGLAKLESHQTALKHFRTLLQRTFPSSV